MAGAASELHFSSKLLFVALQTATASELFTGTVWKACSIECKQSLDREYISNSFVCPSFLTPVIWNLSCQLLEISMHKQWKCVQAKCGLVFAVLLNRLSANMVPYSWRPHDLRGARTTLQLSASGVLQPTLICWRSACRVTPSGGSCQDLSCTPRHVYALLHVQTVDSMTK